MSINPQLIPFHFFFLLAVWTAMPTPVPHPHPQLPSSLLPKQPSLHLREVQCLLEQWPVLAAMLRLRHLYLELTLLRLPLVLHLLPSQPVPPTSQPTRWPPLPLLRPQWSTMPAVICWQPYAWVRALTCAPTNRCYCYASVSVLFKTIFIV